MSQRRRLQIVLALNMAMIAALVIVGIGAGSLGAYPQGGDYVPTALPSRWGSWPSR